MKIDIIEINKQISELQFIKRKLNKQYEEQIKLMSFMEQSGDAAWNQPNGASAFMKYEQKVALEEKRKSLLEKTILDIDSAINNLKELSGNK